MQRDGNRSAEKLKSEIAGAETNQTSEVRSQRSAPKIIGGVRWQQDRDRRSEKRYQPWSRGGDSYPVCCRA